MNDGKASPQLGPKASVRDAVIQFERNEISQAETSLSQILADTPDDAPALQLLGVLRRTQGRLAEAEQLYRRSLAIEPGQPQVHHNLGNLLKALGRLDESIAEQREAVRLKPNYTDAHLGLALALSTRGDHAAAEKCCRDILRLQPNYLLAKQTLAAELCALNRPKEAERLLRQALALGIRNPGQAAAFEHNLGVALKQQRQFSEALALFDAAQAKVPNMPAMDYSRGNTLQQLGRLDEAAESYRTALAREPDHFDTLACLALISAQMGDFATARECAERALARGFVHPVALVALAMVDIEAREFAAAERKLRHLLDDPAFASDRQASFAAGFAADALDRHNCIPAAFAIYRDSNEAQRRQYEQEYEPVRAIKDANRLIAYFEKSRPWSAGRVARGAEGGAAHHVFVLGFMRSGTTLLETILATNSQVVHIDEVEFLTGAARTFLLSDGGLDGLSALEESEAAKWRDAYWKSIRDAGFSVAGKIFVDKMPFNTLRLPLISRLFPSAKVIFAVRDPRDVVLSCFRHRFNPSPYSFEFFRLDDCARFYAATMSLADLYREKLPLNLHEHRYEDMVAAFEQSLRSVCEFIGMEWVDAMRDFRTAAEAIDRRSPSAAQVRNGLYADAAGQWRRYRDQLTSVLPVLEPWIARFGYSMQ